MFGNDARPFRDATVHIWVEDTTYADAPAVVLASWTQRHVSHASQHEAIAFDVTVNDAPSASGRRMTVRALVDLDGDDEPSVGDYLNVDSIRVPAGEDVRVDVRVTRVNEQGAQQ